MVNNIFKQNTRVIIHDEELIDSLLGTITSVERQHLIQFWNQFSRYLEEFKLNCHIFSDGETIFILINFDTNESDDFIDSVINYGYELLSNLKLSFISIGESFN